MEHNLGNWPGMQRSPSDPQSNPFGNVLHGAGSGIIHGSLGAYGKKFFGSSSEFMQSNIAQHLSDPQYYFQVNGLYVRNKLKVILFPFLHRGHWTRITEPVAGRLSYKPPIQDINAPDLYIPFMAFDTYIVLTGFYYGVFGRFSPEAPSLQFTKGLFCWLLEVLILKGILYSMGNGEAPLFDIVAYGGYAFAALSLAIMARMFWSFSYYFMLPWICICTVSTTILARQCLRRLTEACLYILNNLQLGHFTKVVAMKSELRLRMVILGCVWRSSLAAARLAPRLFCVWGGVSSAAGRDSD